VHRVSPNRRALGSLLFPGCVFLRQLGKPWVDIGIVLMFFVVLPLMYVDWRAERDREEEAGRLRLR
jgi:hypothetical protein